MCIACAGYGQTGNGAEGTITINGIVVDSAAEHGIPGITIFNLSSHEALQTGPEGRFSTTVTWGARLQFSGVGLKTRFVTFSSQPLSELKIVLRKETTELAQVVVKRRRLGYKADSTERHETYARTLARKHEGGIMSPASFLAEKLSKKSKRMFQFQKDFAAGEEQRYVDSRYTPQITTAMTGLSGDTLACFINAYPMTEDLARGLSDLEIKQWVRNNYRDWLAKGKPMPALVVDSAFHR